MVVVEVENFEKAGNGWGGDVSVVEVVNGAVMSVVGDRASNRGNAVVSGGGEVYVSGGKAG